jgi:hypothetical protein
VLRNDVPRIEALIEAGGEGDEFGTVENRSTANRKEKIRLELAGDGRDFDEAIVLWVRGNATNPANFAGECIERRLNVRPSPILSMEPNPNVQRIFEFGLTNLPRCSRTAPCPKPI